MHATETYSVLARIGKTFHKQITTETSNTKTLVFSLVYNHSKAQASCHKKQKLELVQILKWDPNFPVSQMAKAQIVQMHHKMAQ
jgi:hypothetical protein